VDAARTAGRLGEHVMHVEDVSEGAACEPTPTSGEEIDP
jgi:hypothetical protein